MIARHALATLALATVTAAAAPSFAQSTAQPGARAIATTTASGLVATRPSRGLVPLRIDVTQPRRVMVRDASTRALTELCTTPCRIYVQPGHVDITLVGWNSHEYHWDIPETGGSMHLLARLPSGQLDTMPAEAAPRSTPTVATGSAVAQRAPAAPTASTNDVAAARIHAAFGIGAFAAAVSAVAHGVALAELANASST